MNYNERLKSEGGKNDPKSLSKAWKGELPHVQQFFQDLAKKAEENHKKSYPRYKYRPSPKKRNLKKRNLKKSGRNEISGKSSPIIIMEENFSSSSDSPSIGGTLPSPLNSTGTPFDDGTANSPLDPSNPPLIDEIAHCSSDFSGTLSVDGTTNDGTTHFPLDSTNALFINGTIHSPLDPTSTLSTDGTFDSPLDSTSALFIDGIIHSPLNSVPVESSHVISDDSPSYFGTSDDSYSPASTSPDSYSYDVGNFDLYDPPILDYQNNFVPLKFFSDLSLIAPSNFGEFCSRTDVSQLSLLSNDEALTSETGVSNDYPNETISLLDQACVVVTKFLYDNNYILPVHHERISELIYSNSLFACEMVAFHLYSCGLIDQDYLHKIPPQNIVIEFCSVLLPEEPQPRI